MTQQATDGGLVESSEELLQLVGFNLGAEEYGVNILNVQEINRMVEITKVQNMIEQIATASDEQSAAAEQISGNVGRIATVSKQSAQGAEQMASTAERLNRQTDALNELVNKFKLEEGQKV